MTLSDLDQDFKVPVFYEIKYVKKWCEIEP